MGVGTNDNAWWNDVLENGPASRYGAYFDIAWRASPRPELQDKVLLPVLGEPYGDVLEAGQLRLAFADGAFFVHYGDRRFPGRPAQLRQHPGASARRAGARPGRRRPRLHRVPEHPDRGPQPSRPHARPTPTRSPSASARRR